MPNIYVYTKLKRILQDISPSFFLNNHLHPFVKRKDVSGKPTAPPITACILPLQLWPLWLLMLLLLQRLRIVALYMECEH